MGNSAIRQGRLSDSDLPVRRVYGKPLESSSAPTLNSAVSIAAPEEISADDTQLRAAVQSLVIRSSYILRLRDGIEGFKNSLSNSGTIRDLGGILNARLKDQFSASALFTLMECIDSYCQGSGERILNESKAEALITAISILQRTKQAIDDESTNLSEKYTKVRDYLSRQVDPVAALQELEDQAARDLGQDFSDSERRTDLCIGRSTDVIKEIAGKRGFAADDRFMIEIDSDYVSRFHGAFIVSDLTGICFYKDVGTKGVGSRNGSTLNGSSQALDAGKAITLIPGDFISLTEHSPDDTWRQVHVQDAYSLDLDRRETLLDPDLRRNIATLSFAIGGFEQAKPAARDGAEMSFSQAGREFSGDLFNRSLLEIL